MYPASVGATKSAPNLAASIALSTVSTSANIIASGNSFLISVIRFLVGTPK